MRKSLKTLLGLLICVLIFGASACDLSIFAEDYSKENKESSSEIEEVHIHTWHESKITVAAECKRNGEKIYSCPCGEIKKETIYATGHSFENDICLDCGKSVSEGLKFELNEDNASYSVRLGACTDVDIAIPESYKGLPVTEIGEVAFQGHKTLESVVIPNSVSIIKEEAFSFCDNLANVVIGKNVAVVEEWAFYSCDKLESVNFPDAVTAIHEMALAFCDGLTSVALGASLTDIADDVFYCCERLTEIIVSEKNEAFKLIDGNLYTKDGTVLVQYVLGNQSVCFSIPNGVIKIGGYAFASCVALERVEIPNSVTAIGKGAFVSCKNIKKMEIPDSVTEIGREAFCYCRTLTDVKISKNIAMLEDYVFFSCDALINITIPEKVVAIGEGAFAECLGLRNVILGEKLESVGRFAFGNCSNLASVYYMDTAMQWDNICIAESNNEFLTVPRYYYSEKQPMGEGNWWHYVNDKPMIWELDEK